MSCNGASPSIGEFKPCSPMECSTIITCAGDEALFQSLESNLMKGVPVDVVDWQRAFSRPIKQVRLRTKFVTFSQNLFPTSKDWHLIDQPVFHIYWSDCSDVDVYKTSLKEKIQKWIRDLEKFNVQDWMIVLVETYDLKKGNKLLPRTTVLDKLRNDFASKHADRCISVINPIKSESRSAESWRGLLTRIRYLTLAAYDKTLLKFEELIRDHRERRNQPGWNFCHYFLLQEELAFVLEMLGLYDEALVQYDELDALFSQFVLNSTIGDTPAWLTSLQSPLNSWAGVRLTNLVDNNARQLLSECKASLLDFRSYLFSRQCAMLLSLNKPWEVAQRCLSFVHNTLSEVNILEVQKPEGSVECWAFLCCLEVLHACQISSSKIEDNEEQDLCSLHTALSSLWALASDKLGDLGKLCGLMPGSDPSSEQLHTVVYLISGMGDSDLQEAGKQTPTDKLKEALSSKDAFQKQYLEHAELAMGTYKHVGRIRSARLIGKELARFYSELGEYQKAAAFLSDALKTYLDEDWLRLAAQTRLELAQCYKRMDDVEKYTKICATIAATNVLHVTVRNSYLDEMLAYLKLLLLRTEALTTEFNDVFVLEEMEVKLTDKVVQDCMVSIRVTVRSLFPRPVKCSRAAVSVEQVPKVAEVKRKGSKGAVLEQPIELLPKITQNDMKKKDPSLQMVPIYSKPGYQENKSLCSASVTFDEPVKQLVRRSDSAKHRKPSVNTKGDFSNALTCEEFVLQPGCNTFEVSRRVDQPGIYKVGQLSLIVETKLDFLSSVLNPRLCYEVAKTPPTINLNCVGDLLAGLVQNIELVISTGSVRIAEGDFLKLRTSRGLTIFDPGSKGQVKELSLKLPACEPFQTISLPICVIAELPPKKDSSSMEHKLNINCPWDADETIPLHFGPPFMSTMKLHTAKHRKFVQIIVTGLASQLIQLIEPELKTSSSVDINFHNLNPVAGQKLIVCNGTSVFFMWELEIGKEEKTSVPVKTDFRVKYIPIEEHEREDESASGDDPLHIHKLQKLEERSHMYKCNFDVIDYVTLFIVSSKVEAAGTAGDFCRAGSMCHLCLTVTRMLPAPNPHPQLMYEVLADQTMWAVCGRTADTISLEDDHDKQSVTLDVMPLTSGYLPLPVVRLSRYIPATEIKNDTSRKSELVSGPKLEPFSPGQVYNASKAQQVHVLPAPSDST